MGKVLAGIDDALRAWIARQPLFFVGTAPRADDGHVNVSPKGPAGALRVLDEGTVAWLDIVGSGAETIAHLRENGRIVVMFCAFDGPPRIVRLHGRGEVVLPGDARFPELAERCAVEGFSPPEARRSVIVVHVTRVSDSCGYTVPRMRRLAERPQMRAWCAKKLGQGGRGAFVDYQRAKNAVSIDGLPAVPPLDPRTPEERGTGSDEPGLP